MPAQNILQMAEQLAAMHQGAALSLSKLLLMMHNHDCTPFEATLITSAKGC
jgi:hypothetical protein